MAEDKMSDAVSLGEARQWLRDRLDKGAKCPCCTQRAQIYRWSLYSTAAKALILFYRLGAMEQYVHVNELRPLGYRGQGDTSRLAFWGLLEEEKKRRDDGGRAGFWRLTDDGRKFVLGITTVPKYLYVYDGAVLPGRPTGPPITIWDALGKKFNYNEVMGLA